MPKVQEKISLEWTSQEFKPSGKKALGATILVLATLFFVASIISGNFTGAILAVLAGFTLLVFSQKKPRQIKFKINAQGIAVGPEQFDYDTLKKFWIFYDPPRLKEVVVQTSSLLSPRLHLPLGDTDPNAAREILIKYLPEEKQAPSLVDNISRSLGF
jgi:hypothetical protein